MVRRVTEGWNVRLIFEPGRLIVANAGVLLARVIRIKPGAAHPLVIVDAAMNDLMRPALYDAYHRDRGGRAERRSDMIANVVGPVCESGDTFATAREHGRGRGRATSSMFRDRRRLRSGRCRAATTAGR